MKRQVKAIRAEIAAKMSEQKPLFSKMESEGLSDEEAKSLATLDAELDALEAELKDAEALEAMAKKAAARQQWLDTVPEDAGLSRGTGADTKALLEGQAGASIPAVALNSGRVGSFKTRTFTTADGRSVVKSAERQAQEWGMWFLAGPCGVKSAAEWCARNGIPIVAEKATGHLSNVGSLGAYLIPVEFEASIIDLREKYGVIRRYARVVTMRSDTKLQPRRTGGLTAYPLSDGAQITESKKGWDQVNLVAKKWGVLAKLSSELDEDAAIDVGNDLAEEIVYAFSQKEDECGFNGDGTSTYTGITGIREKLKGLDATVANIAGLVVGSGNAWGELVLSDFNGVKAKLPVYAQSGDVAWYCSSAFYHQVMEKLALAAGGTTPAQIAAGVGEPMFMGKPVRFVQCMPETEANSQVAALYGNLRLGAMFGDRRMSTIAMSEHNDFETDQIAVRGTERFDFVAHDVGNASATAALRKPGPIVGLITAAA